MKKIYVLIVIMVVAISSVFVYGKIEEMSARNYVEEFLRMSYGCNTENVEEVLEAQAEYYEATMRQICEKNPPVDVEYFKETEQEMYLVSDIYMTLKKNTLGNHVVHAEFIVEFKDVYEPEGFEEKIKLDITLIKDGIFSYQISDIR